jgi:signal transduction histidine kinase/ligand-binding sensor domain-containing protein
MLFHPRTLVFWTLSVLAAVTGRSAVTSLANGYSLRVWQTEDGLPENLVTSVVQTKDGYLWFGTYSGLTRFDGERFRVFNATNTPGMADRRIARLFEDAQGTLWIGHEAGAITRYANGRFERFSTPSGSDSERIIGLGSDEAGGLWAMRDNGAVDSLDRGNRLPSLLATERPGQMGWSRGPGGGIWLWENGRPATLKSGRLVQLAFPSPQDTPVSGLVGSLDGGVWVLTNNRIRKWKDNRWSEDRGPYPWPPATISCGVELQDGTLAVGTVGSGLYLVFPDGRPVVHFDRLNGLPQDWVRCLYEDREGTLWAGIGSTGLVSIRPSPFSMLGPPDSWQGCSLLSVTSGPDGALWVGTDGAGLYRHLAGKWTVYRSDQGLGNQYICSVAVTPNGDVWAGHYWWGGPHVLDQGRFVSPPSVSERWTPAFALLPVPGTDELLVGNRDGLLRMNRERSQWLIRSPEGSADDACAVTQDRDGVIWCGFAQGGLARLKEGEVTVFRRKDGLGSDSVQCLFADTDGALWIGTADGGLTRFKEGRFTQLGPKQGLADTIICKILDDGLGYFWLSTHHGLQRVAKTELNRCADGLIPVFASQVYDRNDGLPIVEFLGGRQASACRTADGRLWFASSAGLISVDPSRIRPNLNPPPVKIESLVVDGRTVPIAAAAVPGHLPPDHERLEFRFSGLSFAAPSKVLFRYQLEGIDKGWIDAGSKRTAFYSRLPAGTYRFRVIACNNDGLWNLEPATLTFTITPFFWETWWFVGSSIIAAGLAIALIVRYVTHRRLQRRIEQMERQHEIERERARIAQDIHDDVGASLSRIAMLSQPARRDLAEPERSAAMLSRIYTTAREVTRSLDEIVWAVDPRHDTLDSLVDYMSKFAQDYLTTAGLRCRLDLPVSVPAWPLTAEIRHNLFLAFKEALHNAVKHAAATQVSIALRLQPAAFTLVVQDNGRGFDPAQPAATGPDRLAPGHGLANMRKRLARTGGRCEVASVPGGGTSVSLIVNLDRPTLLHSRSP